MDLKKRKGASTVLVMFMVIVLVIFGLFTIVSANVNYKLSKKSSTWNSSYYLLDKKAEEQLATVDKILFYAEHDAVKFTIDKCVTYEGELDEVALYTLMNDRYKSNVLEKLNELALSNADFSVDKQSDWTTDNENAVQSNDNTNDNILFSMNIKDDEDENLQIQVVIEVKDILYEINNINDEFVCEKIFDEQRYDIKQWKQHQEIIATTTY